MEIGPVRLVETGERRPFEGETTTKGQRKRGVARIFEVTGPDLDVEIADVSFENGKRDIRMLDRRAVVPLDRLTHGLRVGVHAARGQRWWVLLRLPAVGARGTVTWHKTNLEELNRVCGFDVREALIKGGAVAVNRAELAIGSTKQSKDQLCAVFESEGSSFPAVAYTITPLIAFWRQFG
jgi:hypothetical protein